MKNLCHHHTGCFGCCGYGFGDYEEIMGVIEKNTMDFQAAESMESFRDRAWPDDLNKGLCRNFGRCSGEKYGCLIYPEKGGDDLREGHCLPGYECITLRAFKSWDEKRREAFLNFLTLRNLDVYRHSIGLGSGKLMQEFERSAQAESISTHRTQKQRIY